MAAGVVEMSTLSSLDVTSVARSHHIYKEVWKLIVGERLLIMNEVGNAQDRIAVSVQKEGPIVGHVPRQISRIIFYFLRREGTAGICVIVGRRKKGKGLEVPCIYQFHRPKSCIYRTRLSGLILRLHQSFSYSALSL